MIPIIGIITLQTVDVIIGGRNGKTTPRDLSMAITTKLCIDTAAEIS